MPCPHHSFLSGKVRHSLVFTHQPALALFSAFSLQLIPTKACRLRFVRHRHRQPVTARWHWQLHHAAYTARPASDAFNLLCPSFNSSENRTKRNHGLSPACRPLAAGRRCEGPHGWAASPKDFCKHIALYEQEIRCKSLYSENCMGPCAPAGQHVSRLAVGRGAHQSRVMHGNLKQGVPDARLPRSGCLKSSRPLAPLCPARPAGWSACPACELSCSKGPLLQKPPRPCQSTTSHEP